MEDLVRVDGVEAPVKYWSDRLSRLRDEAPVGRGTRVRLRHHGFVDQPTSDRHAAGWEHYLPRLAVGAGGGEPVADPWRNGPPPSGGA